MKKLVLLVLGFVMFKVGYAQYPIQQFIGADSAVVTSKGGLQGRLINQVFADTTAANSQRIRQYPGAMIYASGKLWYRNTTATKWIELTSSSTDTNIYNSDGTLTGNRTLTGANYQLTFTGLKSFNVSGSDSVRLTTPNQYFILSDTLAKLARDGKATILINSQTGDARLVLNPQGPVDEKKFEISAKNEEFWIAQISDDESIKDTVLFVNNVRKVGIGTTNVDSTLTVGGGIHATGGLRLDKLPTSPGTKALRINGNGVVSVADTSSLSGFVPYVGATQNVNLGQFGLKTEYVEFDTTLRAPADRTLSWSNDDGTLYLGMTNGGSITQKVGLQQFARVKNVDNVQINKGQAVYIFGASGDRASVKRAFNKADSASSKVLGVAAENIPVNDVGLVGTFGTISNLNLASFTAGQILYLDSIPGQLTATKPQAPYHLVFVGVVERANAGNGLLFVNPQNGYELDELHNVRITSPVRNNAILSYDSVAQLWKDTTLNGIGGITGSGTTNYLSKFTDTSTIGNSLIFDNGTNIGIGTTSPENPLDILSTFPQLKLRYSPTKKMTVGRDDTNGTIDVFDGTSTPIPLWINPSGGQTIIFGAVQMSGLSSAPGTKQLRIDGSGNVSFADTLTNGISGTGTSGQVAYWTGSTTQSGSNNLFWDNANGRLGIGTTSPTQKLEVVGNVSIPSGYIQYFGSSRVFDNSGVLNLRTASNPMTFSGNDGGARNFYFHGNVGIGTTSPVTNLQVHKTTAGLSGVQVTNSTTGSSISDGLFLGIDDSQAYVWNYENTFTVFATNNSERMRITSGGNILVGTTTDAGFRLDVNGTLRSTGGAYFATSSGNVGIGTSSPSAKLDVVGSGYFSNTITAISPTANAGSPHAGRFWSGDDSSAIWRGAIAVQHNANTTISAGSSIGIVFSPLASTGSGFYGHAAIKAVRPNATANNQDTDLAFWTRAGASNSTTDSEKMRITSAGNVGIGTTSPTTYTGYTTLAINNATNGGVIDIMANGTVTAQINSTASTFNINSITAIPLVFATNSAERMRITSAGNVGIGTTSPASQLGVFLPNSTGGGISLQAISGATYAKFGIINPATNNNSYIGSITNNDFLFYTNNAEKMRITSGGNVGIGTSSPTTYSGFTTLSINNATNGGVIDIMANGTVTAQINSTASTFNINSVTAIPLVFATNSAERMRITSGGNLLLGSTTDGGQRLQVTGTTSISPAANSSALVSSGYSVTGSGTTRMIDLSGTWNTTGAPTAIFMNITNTASGGNPLLIDLQISGTSQFKVNNNGAITIGNVSSFSPLGTSAGGDQRLVIYAGGGSVVNNVPLLTITTNNNITSTSGTTTLLSVGRSFAPTSGNAVYNVLNISNTNTINQTGGANGITRGLYVDPTLTAAADWRSIEWSNNSGWGIYGAGTANNYLNGSLIVGETTSSNAVGIGRILINSTAVSVNSDREIRSSVSTAIGYRSRLYTRAETFTLSELSHFKAEIAALSGGASITNNYGFHVTSDLTTATNNFGFYGNIPSGTGRWNLFMNGTAANYMNGNLLLGSTTDGGQRLQVTGTTQLTPAANSSALTSTGYSVTGSANTYLISLTGTWNTTGTPTGIFMNITNTASNADSRLMDLQVGGSPVFRIGTTGIVSAASVVGSFSGVLSLRSTISAISGNYLVLDNNSVNITTTSGVTNHTIIRATYAPTSGTGTFSQTTIQPTINQTGGANGITRGLYINPTLTAAADWRSIEWSNNTGFGLYGVGTADNAVAGSLNVGSATSANAAAQIEITSTTKGLLLSRMTGAQAEAITAVDGLIVYINNGNGVTITSVGFWGYSSGAWSKLN